MIVQNCLVMVEYGDNENKHLERYWRVRKELIKAQFKKRKREQGLEASNKDAMIDMNFQILENKLKGEKWMENDWALLPRGMRKCCNLQKLETGWD